MLHRDEPILGRDAQLRLLTDALERADQGEGRLVLVAGDAGIGKSRLVAEFMSAVGRPRRQIGRGDCYELQACPAFGPFLEAARGWRAQADAALDPGTRRLLERLCSGTLEPDRGEGANFSAELDRDRVFHAFARLLEVLAAPHATVLVLEDLHWADASSLDLLRYLAAWLPGRRALVIGTYRTDELTRRHPLSAALAGLRRDRLVFDISLPPLAEPEIGTLARAILGRPAEPEFLAALARRSEGNPYYIEEICQAARVGETPAGEVPASLRDVALVRMASVDGHTRAALEAASVLGRRFEFGLLQAIAAADEPSLLGALREAIEAHLVVEEADRHGEVFAFRHALTAEALYADLLGRERRRHHRSALVALELANQAGTGHRLGETGVPIAMVTDAGDRLTVPVRPAPAATLAWHAARAHDHDATRRYGLEAARQASGARAYAAALGHYLTTLEAWDEDFEPGERRRVRAELAQAAWLGGRPDLADRIWRELAVTPDGDTAEPVDRETLSLAVDARLALGRAATAQGDLDKAGAWLREAVELASPDDAIRRAAALVGLANVQVNAHDTDAIATARLAVSASEASGDQVLAVTAHRILVSALQNEGELEEALDLARPALRRALDLDLSAEAAFLYRRVGGILERKGRWGEAFESYRQTLRICETDGLRGEQEVCVACLSILVFTLGDWAMAEQFAERAVGESAATGGVIGRIGGEVIRLTMAVARGRLGDRVGPELEGPLRATLTEADRLPFISLRLLGSTALARLLVDQGRVDEARRTLESVLDAWKTTPDRYYVLPALVAALEIEVARGQYDRARDHVAELEQVLAETGGPVAEAHTRHASGLLALALGDPDGAVRDLERAVAQWRELGPRLELGRSLAALAQAYARRLAWGDGVRAKRALSEARDCFDDLEATRELAALERVRRSLRGLDRSPAPDEGDAGRLTARERDVLALVAAGMTNKEIAAELGIAAKTAGIHVSNILGKLGLSSRAQAARFAVEHGLAAPLLVRNLD